MTTHRARFSDGETSAARAVTARLVEAGGDRVILILAEDEQEIARWPVSEVFASARVDATQPLTLACSRMPMARLRDLDGGLSAALGAVPTHDPARRATARVSAIRLGLAGLGAIISILVAFIWGVPYMAGTVAAWIPPAWEARLGDAVRDQVGYLLTRGRDPDKIVCTGAAGDLVLRDMLTRIQAGIAEPRPVQVEVWDLPVVNAVAIPGGRIILFRGIIDAAGDLDALAFVLAHEYAHVQERHPTEAALKVAGGVTLLSVLIGDATGGAAVGALAEYALRVGYVREAEEEADRIALEVMRKANFGLAPAANLFERFAKAERDTTRRLAWLQTHPLSAARARLLRDAARDQGPSSAPHADWIALLSICD